MPNYLLPEKRRLLFSLFLMSIGMAAFSQQQKTVDSLKQALASQQTDTAKVSLYVKLSNILSKTDIPSSIQYATDAVDVARRLNSEAKLTKIAR